MKTFFSILVLSLLVSLHTNAQEMNLDSLESLLATSEDKDVQVECYVKLIEGNTNINDEKALSYIAEYKEFTKNLDLNEQHRAILTHALFLLEKGESENTIELCKTLISEAKDPEIIAKSINVTSLSFSNKGALDSAMHYAERYLEKITKHKMIDHYVDGHQNLAIMHCMMGRMPKCDSLFRMAYKYALDVGTDIDISKISFNMGLLNISNGKISEGMEFFRSGYNVAKRINQYSTTAAYLNQLARGSIYANDTLKALEYWEEGQRIAVERQLISPLVSDLMRGYAQALIDIDDYDKAISTLEKLISLGVEKFPIELASAQSCMALAYAFKRDRQKSNKYIDIVLPDIDQYRGNIKYFNVLNGIIPSLIENGRNNEALSLLPDLKAVNKGMNDESLDFHYHKFSYKIYKNLGKYPLALEHHEEYKRLEDQFTLKTNNQKLLDSKVKFDAELKESENSILKDKNALVQANNRNLALGVGLLILLLGLLTALLIKNKNAKKTIEKQNLKLSELNNTKNKLFSIISHDLRNEVSSFQNINSIFKLHLDHQNYDRLNTLVDEIGKSAVTLNTLMDNLLKWASSQLDGIQMDPQPIDLANQARDILTLFEQYSMIKGIDIQSNFDVDTQVLMDRDSLHFILRNIINNAVKYSRDGDVISLDVEDTGNELCLKIKDTGIGMGEEKLNSIWSMQKKSSQQGTRGERGAGIGMSLVKDFIERNQGRISIESKFGEGTTVSVFLPKAS